MADTRADVVIPAKTWVNLYTATGITLGLAISIYNKGSNYCLLAIKATAPSTTTTGFPVYAGPVGSYASIPVSQTGLWAYSEQGTILLVQE